MTTTARVNNEQMSFCSGPFGYEYIDERKEGKWRIFDKDDNAVGSAETEIDAKALVKQLNDR